MVALVFDARTVAPDTGTPEALPAGWYNAQITETEMKPTKDGTGAYLALTLSVLDGQYASRKVFARLNLRNANPTAQEIAYKQLSAICHAVGVIQMQDTQELQGKPMKVKVKFRAATADYEASNDVAAWRNINDPTAVSAAPGGGVAAAGPAAGVPAGFNFAQPAQQAQQPQQQFMQPAQQQPAMQQQPVQQAPGGQQWQMPAGGQPWQAAPGQAPQQQPVQQQMQPQMQPAQQQPVQQYQGGQEQFAQPQQHPGQPAQQYAHPAQQMHPAQAQPVQQAPQQFMQPAAAQQQPAQQQVVQQLAGAIPPWQQ